VLFLDPKKPTVTCISESCDKCTIRKTINCHFSLKQLTYFYVIVSPTFLLGGAGIYNVSGRSLVLWLFLIAAFFVIIEIRVMCSHCPHYAEPGASLKCWANYGIIKVFTYRPGPMSLLEKSIFLSGFTTIWGYPIFFLFISSQWFLLIVYLLTVMAFFTTLKLFLCSRCTNFACPLNGVEISTKKEFFKLNPEIAKAWDEDV